METQPQPSVADEILSQLGGRRKLSVSIGAKDFYSDNDGSALIFKIGAKAKNKIDFVKIQLNSMDTYDVTFSRIRRKKDMVLNIFIPTPEEVSSFEGVYCDSLKELIESETGLYLSPF